MKTIKFSTKLVPLVLSGEKTSTWRLFDDKNLQVGDECKCVNSETGETFGRMVITALKEKILGDIRDEDFVGHEKFESREQMFEKYKEYYGDKVTPEVMVKMLTFTFEPIKE